MKNTRSLAIAVIVAGLVSLALGVTSKFMGSDITGFSPRGFGLGTGICFLLSINLLLLDNKSKEKRKIPKKSNPDRFRDFVHLFRRHVGTAKPVCLLSIFPCMFF